MRTSSLAMGNLDIFVMMYTHSLLSHTDVERVGVRIVRGDDHRESGRGADAETPAEKISR